jgi:hypothetical protein
VDDTHITWTLNTKPLFDRSGLITSMMEIDVMKTGPYTHTRTVNCHEEIQIFKLNEAILCYFDVLRGGKMKLDYSPVWGNTNGTFQFIWVEVTALKRRISFAVLVRVQQRSDRLVCVCVCVYSRIFTNNCTLPPYRKTNASKVTTHSKRWQQSDGSRRGFLLTFAPAPLALEVSHNRY